MSAINESSVNTIRVWTLNGRVLGTALRTGSKDSIVDNLHSNGVCAHINEEYGIVDYPCINNRLDKFLYHPSSNIQLVGYQIPEWEKVIKFATDAAKIIPEVKYIGWDIAIRENGMELIEGNFDPGHDLMQMVTQIGRYDKVKEILKNELS